MQIKFTKNYGYRFAKYIRIYAFNIAKNIIEPDRCKNIDDEFNIKSKDIILFALKNLSISGDIDNYILRINNNILFNSMNLKKLIDEITYGNRTVRGYKIIDYIFNYIQQDISSIYERWITDGD